MYIEHNGVTVPWLADINILEPSIANKYSRIYGDHFAEFHDMLTSWGMTSPTGRTEYGHFEEQRIWNNDIIGAPSAAGAAGGFVTITLQGQTVGSYTNETFLDENDEVEIWDAANMEAIQCIVQERIVAGTTITAVIAPKDGTKVIPALAPGDIVINKSNSWGEKTGQPNPRKYAYDFESGCTQIIKSTMCISGSAKTEDTYLDGDAGFKILKGVDGTNFAYHDLQYKVELEQKRKITQALFSGTKIDNAALQVDKEGNRRTSTEGALSFAERGNVVSIPLGTLTVNDFEALENNSVSFRNDGKQIVLSALARQQEINRVLEAKFAATSNNAQLMRTPNSEIPGESLDATTSFRCLQGTRNKYYFSSMGILDDPTVYNNGNFADQYQAISLMFPWGTFKDPKSGKQESYFGFKYKKKGTYNRRMEVWEDGSAKSRNQIGPIDMDAIYLRSDIGSCFSHGKLWTKITG